MVAGYLAGLTGDQAMVFDSGPQSEIVKFLDSLIIRPVGVDILESGLDFSGLVYTHVDGEMLSTAVEVAKLGTVGAFLAALGFGNVPLALLSSDALIRWGDAHWEGNPLLEGVDPFLLSAGNGIPFSRINPFTWSNAVTLHSCSIPDDHIDPRRSAFFMARSVLRDILRGVRTC